jgi:mannose/fructose/N-acetylgalactosamine-specific phosphotransferase system component IIB
MDFIIRVDDRLIHGQVTAGWVRPLGIERIILANDSIANDVWERDIYKLAVPPEIEVKIFPVAGAVDYMKTNNDKKKSMVVINSLKDALSIVKSGIKVLKVNIGGLHFEAGKKSFATYIFLSVEDVKYAKEIIECGVSLEGREIPGSPVINLDHLIRETENNE